MSGSQYAVAAVLLVVIVGAAGSSWAQAPLTITTTTLPSATVGSNYRNRVVVTGGAMPYSWQVVDGRLPPGLKLDTKRGAIAGTATTAGVYHFEVSVTDSSVPANGIKRAFTLLVTAALTIDWKDLPAVHGQTLNGSVIVSNLTEQDFTLTVIVMAVNQIGRATALGYQEFTLRSGAEQVIPFGASPGPGSYIVHADAVAEVGSTNTIYRARKQTAETLVIAAPE
jgi:putative Ig domain-containing protein